VWGEDEVSIYLCPWHVLKAWSFDQRKKIKDNEVCHTVLDDLHAIMYVLIESGENIDAFKSHEKNKIIESFTQHLANDFWTQYFWAYYSQFGASFITFIKTSIFFFALH
jgi:hypothetical protein